MAQEARISSRIDRDLKTKSEAILAELGIRPSQAIAMFYTQIIRQRGLPLELKIPNDETIAAMNEDLSSATRYSSAQALFDDMDLDEDE